MAYEFSFCRFEYIRTDLLLIGLQINVETQRGFVPVDDRMRVIDADGNLVDWPCPHYCNCLRQLPIGLTW